MNKKWLIFGLLVVGVIAWLALSNSDQKTSISLDGVDISTLTAASDQNGQIAEHVLGDQNGKVIIITYGDYQCSACAEHNSKLAALVKSYSSGVALAFRHFPLPGHPNSRAAAAVAEAAGKQNKFWEMHDLLFQNYLVWEADIKNRDDIFRSYAKQLDLNIEQFNNDLGTEEIKKKIDFDTALGKAHNLTETPTIVINGDKIDVQVWSDENKLRELIDQKLKQN